MDKKAELAIANQTLQKELTECQQLAEVLRSELDFSTAGRDRLNRQREEAERTLLLRSIAAFSLCEAVRHRCPSSQSAVAIA